MLRRNSYYVVAAVCWGVLGGMLLMANSARAESSQAPVVESAPPSESAATSINQTGIELLGHLPSEQNVVYSPLSIATAFAMVYPGARGETARQLGSTLRLPASQEAAAGMFASLLSNGGYTFGARGQANQGYGILLTEVVAASPAAKAGLEPRDLILTINQQPIRTLEQYARVIESAADKVNVCWYSFAAGEVRSADIPLGKPNDPSALSGLEIVNGLWLQTGFPVQQSYLDVLTTQFQAEVGNADFWKAPAAARQGINQWVAGKTRDRVRELFSDGAITPHTRLVLANTVYFHGDWEKPFPASTSKLTWTFGDRSTTVPRLSQTDVFPYAETAEYQAVELPYRESAVSMVLVLPRESLAWGEFRVKFGASIWRDALRNLQPAKVQLVLPKFRVASRLSLRDLYAPRMPLPFSEQADFRGISDKAELRISEALHQAYINVDEQGTEAGAASGLGVVLKQVADAQFVADRPFAFLLRDRRTQAMLFCGLLVWPGDAGAL